MHTKPNKPLKRKSSSEKLESPKRRNKRSAEDLLLEENSNSDSMDELTNPEGMENHKVEIFMKDSDPTLVAENEEMTIVKNDSLSNSTENTDETPNVENNMNPMSAETPAIEDSTDSMIPNLDIDKTPTEENFMDPSYTNETVDNIPLNDETPSLENEPSIETLSSSDETPLTILPDLIDTPMEDTNDPLNTPMEDTHDPLNTPIEGETPEPGDESILLDPINTPIEDTLMKTPTLENEPEDLLPDPINTPIEDTPMEDEILTLENGDETILPDTTPVEDAHFLLSSPMENETSTTENSPTFENDLNRIPLIFPNDDITPLDNFPSLTSSDFKRMDKTDYHETDMAPRYNRTRHLGQYIEYFPISSTGVYNVLWDKDQIKYPKVVSTGENLHPKDEYGEYYLCFNDKEYYPRDKHGNQYYLKDKNGHEIGAYIKEGENLRPYYACNSDGTEKYPLKANGNGYFLTYFVRNWEKLREQFEKVVNKSVPQDTFVDQFMEWCNLSRVYVKSK